MLITRWHLNKKLTMTLPTHPQRKTFRLIPFWTPVNSRETLPLSDGSCIDLVTELCRGGTGVETWAMSWRRQAGLLYSLTGHLLAGQQMFFVSKSVFVSLFFYCGKYFASQWFMQWYIVYCINGSIMDRLWSGPRSGGLAAGPRGQSAHPEPPGAGVVSPSSPSPHHTRLRPRFGLLFYLFFHYVYKACRCTILPF